MLHMKLHECIRDDSFVGFEKYLMESFVIGREEDDHQRMTQLRLDLRTSFCTGMMMIGGDEPKWIVVNGTTKFFSVI